MVDSSGSFDAVYFNEVGDATEPTYIIESVIFWPWRATVGVIRGTGVALGLVRAAPTVLRVGKYTYSAAASAHVLTRPYMTSQLTIREIMATGKGVPDPGGAAGFLRFDVAGYTSSGSGTWQLVVNPETNVIYHFLFKPFK